VEASIRPGVQRRRSGPGGGKGASSIRGPHRWRQASGQVYRDVGVDREVGSGQALYEDRTSGGKHQVRGGSKCGWETFKIDKQKKCHLAPTRALLLVPLD
jgi:hypothetical protein